MSRGDGGGKPLEAVLVLGSGYGALKAVENISHSGLPAAWVTGGRHFLELPAGVEPFEQWPQDLNYQFRPLYLRVTRHRLVKTFTRSRVESLEKVKGGYRAVVVQDPVYIDYDLCTGCSRCMEVCPLNQGDHPPLKRSPAFCPSRALEMDKRPPSPCRLTCPLGVNAQAYMALTAAGRFAEALEVIRRDNPLPGVCGRICHHPCEEACRRGELDQPLAIRDIKRFLFDHEAQSGSARLPRPARRRPEKAAVVGSGPAGLCAAHFLNQAGFQVTVFEAMGQAGGMLRAGINAFRLPRRVLDAEIDALVQSGVEILVNRPVDSLEALKAQGFKAVLLAAGAQRDLRLNIPGEDLAGVEHCVAFLSRLNLTGEAVAGRRAVVIGGGNSAMDAARCALRLGAEQVVVLAVETSEELPASPQEVREAAEEGVEFRLGRAPLEIVGRDRVQGVVHYAAHWEFPPDGPPRLTREDDETETLAADTVIVAISQRPGLEDYGLDGQVKLAPGGRPLVDADARTSLEGVYAAGDAVNGPSTVIQAMADGRRAAGAMAAQLTGEAPAWAKPPGDDQGVGDYLEISEEILKQPRQQMAQRQARLRRRDFDEVDLGFSREQAQAEARRCLQCASCCECLACQDACADVRAIDHQRAGRRLEILAPAIVAADQGELPELASSLDGDVYRIEPSAYTPDLMDVLMQGSSAAGQAMAAAARLRAPAAKPARPATPPPADNGRVGFFICTCNQTMAPAGVLERIRALADAVPGIVHSQLVFSVCNPRGAEQIARTMAEKDISRVILASCVCCPLNFHCISCNDQRTRARLHLFETQGLERSRFEMINLRDHLAGGDRDEDRMTAAARDLLRSAFIRVRFLESLHQGSTDLGRRVLVLGGSPAGVSAARNLALQGFKVRLVHRARPRGEDTPPALAERPLADGLERGVTQVVEAEIDGIQGRMGDFSIRARIDGRWRTWKSDVVCLCDQNLLAMSMYAGRVGLKKFYRYDFAFFNTPQPGVFRIMPRTLERVDAFQAGAAMAGEVAASAARAHLHDHQLSPVVDPDLCRGCGRCVEICPFEAVSLTEGPEGTYTAQVLRHNCVGCGGCVGRCPVTAMDIPYFSNRLLDQMAAGRLVWER